MVDTSGLRVCEIGGGSCGDLSASASWPCARPQRHHIFLEWTPCARARAACDTERKTESAWACAWVGRVGHGAARAGSISMSMSLLAASRCHPASSACFLLRQECVRVSLRWACCWYQRPPIWHACCDGRGVSCGRTTGSCPPLRA